MRQILIFMFCAVALSACQSESANVSLRNAPLASNTNAQTPLPINTNGIKTGQGAGVVTKINLVMGSVELDHEEIKGLMPAMQMEFYIADKKELEPLKVGDKVIFTLEDNHGAEKITKISKVD